MAKIHQFVPRPKTVRTCAGCSERIPTDKPTFWHYCPKCYSFASFRRAIDAMRRDCQP